MKRSKKEGDRQRGALESEVRHAVSKRHSQIEMIKTIQKKSAYKGTRGAEGFLKMICIEYTLVDMLFSSQSGILAKLSSSADCTGPEDTSKFFLSRALMGAKDTNASLQVDGIRSVRIHDHCRGPHTSSSGNVLFSFYWELME